MFIVAIWALSFDEPVPLLDLGKNALERHHPEFLFVEGVIQSAQI